LRLSSRGTASAGSSATETPYISRCRWPDRKSAVSRKVLDGSVPVWTAAPPGCASFSTTTTRLPK
jgi:hypothetical protein